MIRSVTLFVSSAIFVMVISSTSAQAGPITPVDFYTTGVFAGCSGFTGGPTFATCTMGDATLRYDFHAFPAAPDTKLLTDALPTANVRYGDFTMSGGASLSNFSGATFTLNLFQSSPSLGNQPLAGGLTGTVQALSGQLLWGPVSPTSWNIGQVHWTLDVDAATNSIRIDAPDAGGAPGPTQTIRGTVSLVPHAVPEPSIFALMAAGFARLGLVARRRRRATIA